VSWQIVFTWWQPAAHLRANPEQNRKKMAFWMGDPRIKASTYESFKGWESRLLVMAISNLSTRRDAQEVYIGLSRLRKHPDGSMIVVVNCSPELRGFGLDRGWNVSLMN
jgi:hypothetical protein